MGELTVFYHRPFSTTTHSNSFQTTIKQNVNNNRTEHQRMKTGGGKGDYTVKGEHYGRFAKENASLPGQSKNKKRKALNRRDSLRSEARKKKPSPPGTCYASPPRTPPDEPTRCTRGSEITCLQYGVLRRIVYPAHFFCSACDNWERDSKLLTTISRSSRTYHCQAYHKSHIFPTQLKSLYCPSKVLFCQPGGVAASRDEPVEDEARRASKSEREQNRDYDRYDSRQDDELIVRPRQAEHHGTTNVSTTTSETSGECDELSHLKKELEKLRSRVRCLEGRPLANTSHTATNQINLNTSPYSSLLGSKKKMDSLIDEMWNDPNDRTIRFVRQLKKRVTDELKEQYSDYKLHRAMDVKGGVLNYDGVEVVRTCETGGKK